MSARHSRMVSSGFAGLLLLATTACPAYAQRWSGIPPRGVSLDAFLTILLCLVVPGFIGAMLGLRYPSWGAVTGGAGGVILGFGLIILAAIVGWLR